MPLLGQLARGAGAAMLRGKFSRRQGRRGALTAKRGNKDFYKGKGGLKPGVHTPKGGYRFRDTKMIDYRVPDLTGFNLKAYVAHDVPLVPEQDRVPPLDLVGFSTTTSADPQQKAV